MSLTGLGIGSFVDSIPMPIISTLPYRVTICTCNPFYIMELFPLCTWRKSYPYSRLTGTLRSLKDHTGAGRGRAEAPCGTSMGWASGHVWPRTCPATYGRCRGNRSREYMAAIHRRRCWYGIRSGHEAGGRHQAAGFPAAHRTGVQDCTLPAGGATRCCLAVPVLTRENLETVRVELQPALLHVRLDGQQRR